jgi:Ca2+-binding RTX toxin-like protein
MIGGAGADSLFAGTGADTFAGGGGANEFVFYKSVVAGSAPRDVIADFNAADSVILSGYGASAAATALSAATSAAGATTITLSDSTRITFLDVSGAAALQGHVFSV